MAYNSQKNQSNIDNFDITPKLIRLITYMNLRVHKKMLQKN